MATYTTASLVEADIRASEAFSSSTLPTLAQVNEWIDEESRTVELITGQIFSSVLTESVYLDYDGGDVLRLPYNNVQLLTLRYNNASSPKVTPSWITLEEGFGYNYLLYGAEGEVEFIHGNNATNILTPLEGSKRFCVDITHGYTTTPLEAQRLTTALVSKRVILTIINSQANSEGGDVSVGALSISDPSMFSINQIKNLNNEIKELKDNLRVGFNVFRHTRVY